MRKRPRLDANHRAIAKELTAIGCSVVSLAGMGSGVGDLLVGYIGKHGPACVMAEVKTRTGKVRTDQENFRCWWIGPFALWRSVDDAVEWIRAAKR